jgi:hypothetical protein
MMKRILCGVLILTFLFVVGVIQICAQTEKFVTYLSLADYTAAIAGLNVPGDMGTEDYFKELNAKGGVDGVKVKFIGVDTRYDGFLLIKGTGPNPNFWWSMPLERL